MPFGMGFPIGVAIGIFVGLVSACLMVFAAHASPALTVALDAFPDPVEDAVAPPPGEVLPDEAALLQAAAAREIHMRAADSGQLIRWRLFN